MPWNQTKQLDSQVAHLSRLSEWLYPEKSATKRLTVATTTMRCAREVTENRQYISNTVQRIMREHPDTELVCFGEMISGWYNPQALIHAEPNVSEPIPGQTTELLSGLSRKYAIFLCCGLSEKASDGYHNAQVLVNPQGEIHAIHRKWNLKSAEREAGYVPGTRPITTTEINGLKVAMLICSDAAHPRTMRALLRSSADVILFSLADDRDENWFVAKAQARMYGAWIVSANRYGQEHHYWNGHTVISDPLGRLRRTSVDQEGYLVHTLKIATEQPGVRRVLRHIYVKAPLIVHVLRNWGILKSYYQ
ncbi:MAG: carbon-nitrogen hydrolase family protein [Anaerolineae bacterium]